MERVFERKKLLQILGNVVPAHICSAARFDNRLPLNKL